MRLDVTESIADTAIVTIAEASLDINDAQAFRDKIRPVIEKYRNVVIDMTALHFVDSSGLGALISALRAVKANQGELRLYGLTAQVNALFHLVRMHRVFALFASRDDALKGLPPR